MKTDDDECFCKHYCKAYQDTELGKTVYAMPKGKNLSKLYVDKSDNGISTVCLMTGKQWYERFNEMLEKEQQDSVFSYDLDSIEHAAKKAAEYE